MILSNQSKGRRPAVNYVLSLEHDTAVDKYIPIAAKNRPQGGTFPAVGILYEQDKHWIWQSGIDWNLNGQAHLQNCHFTLTGELYH